MESNMFSAEDIKALCDILLRLNAQKIERIDDGEIFYVLDSFYLTHFESVVLDSFCKVGK